MHGHVLAEGPGRGWVSSSIVSSMALHLILLRQGTLLDLKLAVPATLPGSSCLYPEVTGWCSSAKLLHVGAEKSNSGPHAWAANAVTH